MHILLRYLGTVAAVYFTIYLVPGIEVASLPAQAGSSALTGGWVTILLVALVWSVIVTVIRPVLAILTLPITILTFGLFSLILNALLFWLVSAIVPGFIITGFFPALIGVVVLSLLTWLIHKLL